MENREDLNSILGYLPVVLRSSSLFWPPQVVEALKALSRGPDHSNVDSGEVLFLAISDLRHSLNLAADPLPFSVADGFSLFFDDLMSRAEAAKWFVEVLPVLANLLLRLPSLLETHYQSADCLTCIDGRDGLKTGLRLLDSQEAGIVLLSQELIGALLACSLFCLFPSSNRVAKHLPMINLDHLFASLYDNYNEKQENKLKCIIHYFERICWCIPAGNVSFERKVLPLDDNEFCISYPKANSWSKSMASLCPFEVYTSGLIEDQSQEALEVDFANKYFGGGALNTGCVQEEIRFMINPELIAGMLFLPSMAENEAIEIVGAERYSDFRGYASSFRFCGDYIDKRNIDLIGRRKTRITAIDALINPGRRQYGIECLVREINKAFCGFYDQCKYQKYRMLFEDDQISKALLNQGVKSSSSMPANNILIDSSTPCQTNENLDDNVNVNLEEKICRYVDHQDEIGIATGNWGCGVFGGDPELKAVIQWLAASQAFRPFILYYTFGLEALQTLDQVTKWIISHGWNVGDLWNMLVEYSSQRLNGEIEVGFFDWLLPSLAGHEPMMLDLPHVP